MAGNDPHVPDGWPPLSAVPDIRIVFPPFTPRSAASGSRTVAGILAIALALTELVYFFPTVSVALATGSGSLAALAALWLVSALGNFACGVAVLAGRRGRRRAAPILLAGFAVLAILLCLADVLIVGYSADLLITTVAATVLPAVPVLVLIGSSLAREQSPV